MAKSKSLSSSGTCPCLSNSSHRRQFCTSCYHRSRQIRPRLGQYTVPIVGNNSELRNHLDVLEDVGPLSPDSLRSTGSYENASTVSFTTGTTADLERQRFTSPVLVTPTSSEASFPQAQHHFRSIQQGNFYPGQQVPWPSYQVDDRYFVAPPDNPGSTLAGLERIPSQEDTTRFLQRRPEFASGHETAPTSHQRYPQTYGPWNGLDMRSLDHIFLSLDDSSPELTLSPVSSNEKGCRRKGPLSPESKNNAGKVRKARACLRCFYMKETCDVNDKCSTCLFKKSRTWKLGCVRQHLDEFSDSLFPEPLKSRYGTNYVNKYINNSAFTYADRRGFTVNLRLRMVTTPLQLPVKEICVLDSGSAVLQVFQPQGITGNSHVEVQRIWNPPIYAYFLDRQKEIPRIRAKLTEWMRCVLQKTDVEPAQVWPWPMFEVPAKDWEGDVVEMIQQYRRKDLESHTLLSQTLCLLFFSYVLSHTLEISEEDLPSFLSHLENPPPLESLKGTIVSPEAINRIIKALLFPSTMALAKDVLKGLHSLLHDIAVGKATSTYQTDLAFCYAFIILVFLGNAQSMVLMIGELSETESDVKLTRDQAHRIILDMENELGDYVIHLHEFARRRRKVAPVDYARMDASEQHALEFGLMDKVRAINERYGDTHPANVELAQPDIHSFDIHNVHRLCWKLMSAFMT